MRHIHFLGALCNNAFQQALINFLVASWEDDANANIIEDFQIYATCGNQCFSFRTEDGKVRKVEETSLKCSRVLFRAKFINAPNTLVVRTVDTDILVITLSNMPKLFQGLKAWLEVGLLSRNTLRYLNMNEIN